MLPNNIMNNLSQFGSFIQNPMGFLINSKFNIPANVDTNNPNEIMQYLVSNGRVNQSMINQANQMANQIRNNPAFSNMFKTP